MTLLYGAMVVVAPIPYGLVHVIPLTALTVTAAVFSIAALLVFGPPKRGRHVFTVGLVLSVALGAYAYWQSLPVAPPFPAGSLWEEARQLVGARQASQSIAPADTQAAIIYLALPCLIFLTGLMVADTDKRAMLLLKVVGVGAGLIALFGIMQFTLSPNMLLAVEKRVYIGNLTATYVNRNTAATHMGLALLLLVTLAVEAARPDARPAGKDGRGPSQVGIALYSSLAACAFVALVLTQSRAGVAASAVAALFLFPRMALQWSRRYGRGFPQGSLTQRLMRYLPPLMVVAVVLMLLAFFAGRVMFRASVRGLEDDRFCTWPDVLRLIEDNWLFGTGFGTFRTAFSPYRSDACGIGGIFDRAHNSYLEGFATLGLIFPVVLVIFGLVILASFYHGYRSRKRYRQYAALGFAGTLLVAVHAVVDFSLQIPGFAVTYAAFLAATIAICHGRDPVRNGGEPG